MLTPKTTGETVKVPENAHLVLTASEVAQRCRRSVRWFLDNREQLQAAGFPAPLPGLGRWPAAAVEQWLSGTAPEPAPAEVQMNDRRLRLRERAKRVAKRA